MKKVFFTTAFLKSLTFSQCEDVVEVYRDLCIQKDRYYHYQDNLAWNLRDVEKGQVMDLVIRNNDELSFNNMKYQVDNDVALAMLRRSDFDFVKPVGGMAVPVPTMDAIFETKSRIVNCEPAKDGNGMGHLRSSLLIGAHQIRSHAPGGNTSRQFIYHQDGWGKGKLTYKTLERTAIWQRIDEPVPVLRTDGKGNILSGYFADKTSWEVGRGFNDHDVYSNSSLGCITTLRSDGNDDRYFWNFRSLLTKATVKSRAILCLIGCDTMMKICDELTIDYSETCQIVNI